MKRTIEIPFDDLAVTREDVVRECGGAGEDLAGTLDRAIGSLLSRAPAHAEARAGFVLTDERFDTGPTVGLQLEGAGRLAVFLATLGEAFDRWSRGLFDAGDPFSGWIADTIGSVAVEAAVDRIVREIAAVSPGTTNRFSPGYCGWDVADQRRLFDVLPPGFLGVRLTEGAVMVPLKSVSGIVGIGPGLVPRDYPCDVCAEERCPAGRRP